MKNFINLKSVFYLILGTLILSSCDEDQNADVNKPEVFSVIAEQQSFLGIQEKEMLEKMKEASIVLTKIANDDAVNTELAKLVAMEMYNDDFVLFKDLFSPSSNENLKSVSIERTSFEMAFDEAAMSSGLKSTNSDELKNYLSENNLALYIPYPLEDYPEKDRIPAISYHPIVNDSINEGFQPILKDGKIAGYDVVAVSEEYSFNRPVYIIYPASESELISENSENSMKSISATDHWEIRIKKAVLMKHFDGIFAGGSDIFFGATSPVIGANGHVTTYPDGFLHIFSRKEIRNHTRVNVNTLFKSDWKVGELQIQMSIFEEDDEGTNTFTGQVKLGHESSVTAKLDSLITAKVGNTFETTLGFQKVVKTSDKVLFNVPYERGWFFATNNDPNAEWQNFDTTDGLIYRGNKGLIEYTMQAIHRVY